MRASVRFLRNGRVVELRDIRPNLTVLDYLRLVERATGTKASCEEGACGACTVVIGRLRGGRLVYEAMNACALLVAQVDGCEVITIEDIAEDDGTLHPVQQALVEEHATQCGFCTPGMAMSLFALYHATDDDIGEADARAAIQGNLCRCTGYRPIINAGVRAGDERRPTRHEAARQATTKALAALSDGQDIRIGDDDAFFAAPATLDAAAALMEEKPDAALIAGGTYTASGTERRQRAILLSRIPELRRIDDAETVLTLGAAVTLAEAEPVLAAIDPDLRTLIQGIGSPQLRAVTTIGGSLFAGSASDLAVALIALGADLSFRRGGERRSISVDALYRSDGTVETEPGDLLIEIDIRRPRPSALFRAYKVGRRADFARSVVSGAFYLTLDEEDRIDEARLAFAGLSLGPRRAPTAEAALAGASPLDRSVWPKAFSALRDDFADTPVHRTSGRYRADTAQALLGKALIEIGGTTDRRTRLRGFREASDVAG